MEKGPKGEDTPWHSLPGQGCLANYSLFPPSSLPSPARSILASQSSMVLSAFVPRSILSNWSGSM